MDKLSIEYDPIRREICINGFRFTTIFFEHLCSVTPEGKALRVVRVDNGISTTEIFDLPKDYGKPHQAQQRPETPPSTPDPSADPQEGALS